MTDAQKNVSSYVINQLRKQDFVKEDEITKWVDKFSQIIPLTTDEKKEVVEDVQSKLHIKMDRGVCVQEKGHKSCTMQPEVRMILYSGIDIEHTS